MKVIEAKLNGFMNKIREKTGIGKIKTGKIVSLVIKLMIVLLLFGLCFIILYPIIYMLSMTFRPSTELFDPIVVWVPRHFVLDNIIQVFKDMDYVKSFINTLKLDIPSVMLQIISCSFAGYGFARFKFKGKEILFTMVLLTILVPPQITIIPAYLQFRFFDFLGLGKLIGWITGKPFSLNLINSIWALLVPASLGSGIRAGLFIYIFRQFFRGLPKELEDSAYVDGCNPFMTFVRIVVPNAKPAFLTVFLFSIVWYWNDLLNIGMFYSTTKTVSLSLSSLEGLYGLLHHPEELMILHMQAGALLTTIPLLVFYTLFQKYFTESIERTGIVG